MTITNTDIGKRLRVVFKDWQKDKPVGKKGMEHFAKEIGTNRISLDRMMKAEYHVKGNVLDGLTKLGYSTEWVLQKVGKMKADQKASLNFTETVMLRVEVANLRQQGALKDARQVGIEKELTELKKQADLKDARLIGIEKELADQKKEMAELKKLYHSLNTKHY